MIAPIGLGIPVCIVEALPPKRRIDLARQHLPPILWNPDEVISNLIMRPACFSGLQAIAHGGRIAHMERVRLVSLKGISKRTQAIIRNGQRESARVGTLCRDLHLTARTEKRPWPGKMPFTKPLGVANSPCIPQPSSRLFALLPPPWNLLWKTGRPGEKRYVTPIKIRLSIR
jgi:hypothetical protein